MTTAEQEVAFTHLLSLAKPHRYRVVADLEGWPVIPGRYGQVEYYDGRDLAVYSDRPRLFEKLWTIPGVRRWQTGDSEMRALFPPEALDQVAGVVRLKRRRATGASPAVLARARELARQALPRATSRPQDRPGRGRA